MSQPDFLYELFEDFMDDPANQDFSMDNGLVCRWMTGQAKISPKISAYYSKPSNQEKLAHTIHQNLLPLMSDCNMTIQDIYTLFIQDDSISDAKKKNLASLYKSANSRLLFLAKLISFGMERQFIKRDTKNQKLIAGGALSPIVLDYIMDSEVPKPCRHFIGRDKELEELYTMLEENRHVFLYGIAGIGKSELAKAYAKRYIKQYTNENGTWQYKTEKEYLCIKDGEEKGFTASEFKTAQKQGWEKQYRYKVGKKKEYLTSSVAQEKGYERIYKHPKSSRYGRQNPISEQ